MFLTFLFFRTHLRPHNHKSRCSRRLCAAGSTGHSHPARSRPGSKCESATPSLAAMPPSSDSSSSSSDQEGGAPPASVKTAATEGLALRVSFTARKARVCLLCSAKSTDASPLEYLGEDLSHQEVSGRLPWRAYEKVKEDGEPVRAASGRCCLVCFNVYRALGASAVSSRG